MYNVPEPEKFARDISPEQLKAMQPIDKLVQYVVPRLIDKVNNLAWRVDKMEHETGEALAALRAQVEAIEPGMSIDLRFKEVYRIINEFHTWQHAVDDNVYKLIQAVEAKNRRRRSKAAAQTDPADVQADSAGAAEDAVRVRRKTQKENAQAYVPHAEYCMYDPDLDDWVPYCIDEVNITASVVQAVKDGAYKDNPDIVAFVNNLTPETEMALCDKFPE